MALNVAAAEDAGFEVGDTRHRRHPVRAARTTRSSAPCCFGTAKSSAGAVSVEFTLAEAQRLAGTDGRIQTRCSPAPSEGVSQEQLADADRRGGAPDDVEVLTGEEAAAQLSSDVQEGFAFFHDRSSRSSAASPCWSGSS